MIVNYLIIKINFGEGGPDPWTLSPVTTLKTVKETENVKRVVPYTRIPV